MHSPAAQRHADYPKDDYSHCTLREVQQKMDASQYRLFLLSRARDGLQLAKQWEMLPKPAPVKKWDWVLKNWRAATKVKTTAMNLSAEARGWNSNLRGASRTEHQFLKHSRAPTKVQISPMGEVAEDYKDQSVYSMWLSKEATPQERKWRLVASVLLWTASREYSEISSQRLNLVASERFTVEVVFRNGITKQSEQMARAAFRYVAELNTTAPVKCKILAARGREPCRASLEKMTSENPKSFLTLCGSAQTHAPFAQSNSDLVSVRKRCEQHNLFRLIGAQLYTHSKARCVTTTVRFVETALSAHAERSVDAAEYHALATRHHREPLLMQSTLEQKPFLPQPRDTDIKSENRRGRLLDGLTVPSLMSIYEEVAHFLKRYETVVQEGNLKKVNEMTNEAHVLLGRVCRGNLEVHRNAPYSAKQIQDMLCSHLDADAARHWIRHVWACPHLGDAEQRYWGTGSNSADAFQCGNGDLLPLVLEEHSEMARLIQSFTITLQPQGHIFEFRVKPEHSCASALQLCACKSSGCTKPILSKTCVLAVKLGTSRTPSGPDGTAAAGVKKRAGVGSARIGEAAPQKKHRSCAG